VVGGPGDTSDVVARSPTAEVFLRAKVALARRDAEQAARCAATLARLGFRVLQEAPSGVTIEGPASLFEHVFSARITLEPSARFVDEPSFGALCDVGVESVYFPVPPTFFGA
jgi:hypothetical protein